MEKPFGAQVLWKVAVAVLLFILHSTAQPHNNYFRSNPGDPWETPLEELQRTASDCTLKIAGFQQIVLLAQVGWQTCIDSITPKKPELEEGKSAESTENVDKPAKLTICHNTTAYKTCWQPVIEALNLCEQGNGNVSGQLYFALYDDICRESGSITLEKWRLAAAEGELCVRNYDTKKCRDTKEFRRANNLCLRFESNTACDLSSVAPNCTNSVDRRQHAEIFTRVGDILQCPLPLPDPDPVDPVDPVDPDNSSALKLEAKLSTMFLLFVAYYLS